MGSYLKPILVVIIVLGLAVLFSHSCVERTGEPYYHHHYPGGIFILGIYHAPRGVIARGGK